MPRSKNNILFCFFAALIGAQGAIVIMNWKEMRFGYLRSAFVGLFIGFNIAWALYLHYKGTETGVSDLAHAGGFLIGLPLGVVVLKNLRVYNHERVLWWISLTIFLVLFIAGVILNVVYVPCKNDWTPLSEYIKRKESLG